MPELACPICGKTCRRPAAFQRHMRFDHAGGAVQFQAESRLSEIGYAVRYSAFREFLDNGEGDGPIERDAIICPGRRVVVVAATVPPHCRALLLMSMAHRIREELPETVKAGATAGGVYPPLNEQLSWPKPAQRAPVQPK